MSFIQRQLEDPVRFARTKRWLYVLASCVVIIVGSKLLGKVWLMRREDYYDS